METSIRCPLLLLLVVPRARACLQVPTYLGRYSDSFFFTLPLNLPSDSFPSLKHTRPRKTPCARKMPCNVTPARRGGLVWIPYYLPTRFGSVSQ
ncbi:hypothetical protein GE21DRAFT_1062100 [Neurospora crassa]|nr:hypothetical protein GE21DRAFT_1062100 [Neurospora crassa]